MQVVRATDRHGFPHGRLLLRRVRGIFLLDPLPVQSPGRAAPAFAGIRDVALCGPHCARLAPFRMNSRRRVTRHYSTDLAFLGETRTSRPSPLPKKARPIAETLEALLEAAKKGVLVHRLEGSGEDKAGSWCPICRRHSAKPMAAAECRIVRELVQRAGLSDRVAFAFATTRILVLESQAFRVCPCDLRAWREACAHYNRMGMVNAWKWRGLRKGIT